MNELAHVEIETEKVLADFLWNEVALALLIEYFWISDGKHSDIFLDGILAIYLWYGLQKKEYEVMRDYSGGEKLWEKFSFRIQSILELGGVRQDMSSQMAEFMSQHFSSALQAHRIYDIVSSPEKLEEEYTIVAKSKKYGSILVKDNTPEIYLLQWKTVYFYSDMTINRQNKIEAIIFPFLRENTYMLSSKKWIHRNRWNILMTFLRSLIWMDTNIYRISRKLYYSQNSWMLKARKI